jgi:aryl-alcohol dehydrogenase-like predicted oxidoreductase
MQQEYILEANMTDKVEMRPLGQTGMQITPIGLGVMQFSGGGGLFGMMFSDLEQETMNAIIKAALDGGINWFDTAEMYGFGRSEQALSTALKAAGKADGDVVIGTKWLPFLRRASNMRRSIHDRIRNLDGFGVDLYMIHQPWSFSSPETEMDVMADLVEDRLIRSVGVSNFSEQHMRRAHSALAKRGIPLAVNQVEYSLLHREIESNGVLQAAKELGITIIAYSPLARGILSGKFHKDEKLLAQRPRGWRMILQRNFERSRPLVEALEKIAADHNATAAQVALNWLVHFQGETVVTIPGASKVNQAADNAGAMRLRLTEAEMTRLDELSRMYR